MKYLGMFLGVLAGTPLLRTVYATVPRPRLSTLEWILFLAAMFVTVHVVIAVHEAGHVAGGRLAGFRFRFVVVGPFRLERAGARIRLRLNRSLADYAGVAASTPADDGNFRRGWIVQLAVGPLASLMAGMIAWFLLQSPGVTDAARSGYLAFLAHRALALFAAGSLAVGIITALPGGTAGRPTDGSRILELIQRE